jgi:serine/tyrosine/threonine adenylyltransferase
MIWWNLTRLGEALGELMGSTSHVDEPTYATGEFTDDQKAEIEKQGERIIEAAGEEYKSVFLEEYKKITAKVIFLSEGI